MPLEIRCRVSEEWWDFKEAPPMERKRPPVKGAVSYSFSSGLGGSNIMCSISLVSVQEHPLMALNCTIALFVCDPLYPKLAPAASAGILIPSESK